MNVVFSNLQKWLGIRPGLALTVVPAASEGAVTQGSDEQAVKDVVERFLSALGDGDIDALPAMFTAKANIGIAALRDGKWVTSTATFEDWFTVQRSRSDGIHFREPVSHFTVHIEDGQLAFVRADASIVVDGEIRSHNIDYFTLMREHGVWKFLSAAYVAKAAAPE